LLTDVGGKKLQNSCDVRFASTFLMIRCFLENKEMLRRLVVGDPWESYSSSRTARAGKDAVEAVTNAILERGAREHLWVKLNILRETWTPMYRALRRFDKQQARLHTLYPSFTTLQSDTGVKDPERCVQTAEELLPGFRKAVADAFVKRRKYLWEHTPGLLLAHALNPLYIDRDLPHDVLAFTMAYFRSAGGWLGLALREQFDKFRLKTGIPPHVFDHVSDPFAWWITAPVDLPQLKQLAKRVMLLTGTATECERAWKDYNGVVTLKRNRLSRKRAAKLVMLYHHLHRTQSARAEMAQCSGAASSRRTSTAGAAAAAAQDGGPSDDSDMEVVSEGESSDDTSGAVSSDDTASDVDLLEGRGGRHVAPVGAAAAAGDSGGGSLPFGGTLDIDEYLRDSSDSA